MWNEEGREVSEEFVWREEEKERQRRVCVREEGVNFAWNRSKRRRKRRRVGGASTSRKGVYEVKKIDAFDTGEEGEPRHLHTANVHLPLTLDSPQGAPQATNTRRLALRSSVIPRETTFAIPVEVTRRREGEGATCTPVCPDPSLSNDHVRQRVVAGGGDKGDGVRVSTHPGTDSRTAGGRIKPSRTSPLLILPHPTSPRITPGL